MVEPATRVVLDTNVLVAAAYSPRSASRRIVDACREGGLVAVASEAILREYEMIVGRSVRAEDAKERLGQVMEKMERVAPARTPRHVPEDSEDDKFLAAAIAGDARWIITNDQHLLELDPYWHVRIVRPGVFVTQVDCEGP